MHIQQGHFGADIEPVYDRATYVLQNYAYTVMDSSKANKVVARGTAEDLKSAVEAAEKHIRALITEEKKRSAHRAA